ncbi:hypothetical protein G4B88_011427 [Cannabis sativa]|uniref:Uncharacterized protein n=1 Tax=Cannabis sativa TaxID=3483 RepID=A0A7J6EZQ4_CANSA|nr:hypothetical protein G4B88_004202 [Cannabis sativa]KAF4382475.1 hypothetical protein G4B88_011427 [Cannabis sativa]
MDFDEYEYLENTVENPEPIKGKETVNGGGGDEIVKSSEKDRSRSSKHRSDDKNDDREHRSRRSKSGEDSRDHDRHKEKGSSRHRSRSKDGDRDRQRSSREHREREDRDKEKSKDKDREERNGRERGERRERDREGGDRERDKDKERSRRSRSHSERHRSGAVEREQSHDKELREREKEKEVVRERDRESRYFQSSDLSLLWKLRRVETLRITLIRHITHVVLLLNSLDARIAFLLSTTFILSCLFALIVCQLMLRQTRFWELADMLEQSSDGLSGNWARHRNRLATKIEGSMLEILTGGDVINAGEEVMGFA